MHPLVTEARSHQSSGHREKALRALALAMKQAADDFDLRLTQALIELQFGDLEKATGLLRAMERRFPPRFEIFFNLGICHRFADRFDLALKAFERADSVVRNTHPVLRHRAEVLAILGEMDAAVAVNRQMIELFPKSVDAYLRIAQLSPEALSETEVRQLASLAADEADHAQATAVHFALGDLLWSRQKSRAFDHYLKANALRRENFDSAGHPSRAIVPRGELPVARPIEQVETSERRMADFVCRHFDRAFLECFSGAGLQDERPVFVIGMPRSGTTLVEQIIASHPQANGQGETGHLSRIAVRKQWPYAWKGAETPDDTPPPMATDAAMRHFAALARQYVAALCGPAPGANRVVDKSLDNFLHIGLIRTLLPNAKIIAVTRDPVDNAIACFRRNFRTGQEWSYDLAAIGRRYVRYRRVMDHWRAVLPDNFHTVSYETLVRDPEAEVRRLIDLCGLPWHDACLAFHESRRPVQTASLAQVRRPIYATSVGTWEPFADRLRPLFEALGPYAPDGVAEKPGR